MNQRLDRTALSVPAPSTSVEHVFSYGILILKPYRLNLSEKMLISFKHISKVILNEGRCLMTQPVKTLLALAVAT